MYSLVYDSLSTACVIVVVTEAEKRSGTMITVGYALDQGKDIYCIPSRIGDPMGCNLLIQQGAKLVLTVNDIIED